MSTTSRPLFESNPDCEQLTSNSAAELEAIAACLKESERYELQIEVIWSALGAMRDDPKISIEEAINRGLDEWIK